MLLITMDYYDDDVSNFEATSNLLHTLGMSIIVFITLILSFELIRHIKAIHLKRVTRKLLRQKRTPPIPSSTLFGWIHSIIAVSDLEFLRMVGLDGYMLLRYIRLCFKASCFFSIFGLSILLPIYHSFAQNSKFVWKNVTISSIENDTEAHLLWFPVVFAYIFCIYFCYLLYMEYKHFNEQRQNYLVHGDSSTPLQTYYTVMVEDIPPYLQSGPRLKQYFEKLFPNQVFSVEICLDLHELDEVIHQRRQIRDRVEKAIAYWHATNKRPKMRITKKEYAALRSEDIELGAEAGDTGEQQHEEEAEVSSEKVLGWCPQLIDIDAIEYYSKLLESLNDTVYELQKVYFSKTLKLDDPDSDLLMSESGIHRDNSGYSNRDLPQKINFEPTIFERSKSGKIVVNGRGMSSSNSMRKDKSSSGHGKPVSIQRLAQEGLATARKATEMATQEAIKGMLEVTRSIELLTVGAMYRTSTTAFVTFTSRVAKSSSHQMVLSQRSTRMRLRPAPNPKDLIWENVSIPLSQILLRRRIADITLMVGAMLWSLVVGFITAISNLEILSRQLPWLRAIRDTLLYKLLNDYLAVALLLMLLTLLPYLFDLIARNYECLKRESEIQNSVMSRYFYYQLANVFVSVGLGSIATSLYEIIQSPHSLFSILGNNLPSFSIYFASVLIIKSLTAVPLELMRIVPLMEIYIMKNFMDKKKCTRRELRSGAFADRPILYGWVYPNLLMVLMILTTYCCIAPLLMPLGALYFALAYLMYKYQLLYVFINEYQSGGFMWYAVFSRSIVALVCGSMTLLGYIGIHMTKYTSGFYSLLPLPFGIVYFWHRCKRRFQHKTSTLSLEDAIEIDNKNHDNLDEDLSQFKRALYCQPSLVEADLTPAPYRRPTSSSFLSPEDFATNNRRDSDTFSAAEDDDEIEKEQHLSELIDLITPIQLTSTGSSNSVSERTALLREKGRVALPRTFLGNRQSTGGTYST